MKEQIQVPFDTNSSSDKDKEEGRPKGLNRPKISSSLLKPKTPDLAYYKANLFRHCNCGSQTCTSPYQIGAHNPWYWVYRDKNTGQIINDPSLPRQGGDGDGWERREGPRFSRL